MLFNIILAWSRPKSRVKLSDQNSQAVVVNSLVRQKCKIQTKDTGNSEQKSLKDDLAKQYF